MQTGVNTRGRSFCATSQLSAVLVYVPTEDGEEREKVKKAGECCKKILNHVNQAVKEAENKQVRTAEAVCRQVAWICSS